MLSTKMGVIEMMWWKNGVLLAAGGVAGLALAAWLDSEWRFDNYNEDYDERPRRKDPRIDGIELLMEKVRRDAEWAIEECTNDEQREKVYAEVRASIKELQVTLEKRGEEIIADLQEKARSGGNPEELDESTGAITNFKSSMEDLTKSLDEMLLLMKPTVAPAGL